MKINPEILVVLGVVSTSVGIGLQFGYQWAVLAIGLCLLSLGISSLFRERRP